ncbi:hypothetical protein Micbo1qcDRAFT_163654 [Microdochium bolleyi]|uniref:MARVEL domain-containing protein n=1 Tax=Microdochium bolleyi TaxID=196109 RepID=A0A136J187_9PEZI|nr:hypothetical protein Micbo1qcDRAFT_163654 [Microdochium bolleyi]
MAIMQIAGMVLRAAELAFGAIVAGINGSYLHDMHKLRVDSWPLARFIYTEVVAAIAIFFALIWLLPFSSSFTNYPFDFFISILWFIAFGLLVHYEDGSCGAIFDWSDVTIRGASVCGRWKAVIAFSFLSAICWLVSAIIGMLWVRDRQTRRYERRRWRGSRV